jgi:PAS domain S-box-containing protein
VEARARPWFQDSADRLQAVWEAAPDAMVLSDANGVVLAVNPAYCQLTGYPPEDLVGHDFALAVPNVEHAGRRAQYRQVFTTAAPRAAYQATVRRQDGSTRVVESRISFLYADGREAAAPDGPARPARRPAAPSRRVAMLSIIRDVTDVVRAERELTAALERERAGIEMINRELAQVTRELKRVVRHHQPGIHACQGPDP